METQLSCQLCQKQYSSDNPARLLTMCGHSFCQNCLKKEIKKKKTGKYQITCPQDSHSIQLIANNVCFFPKNVSLMKVIELKKAIQNDSKLESTMFRQQNANESFNTSQNQFIKSMLVTTPSNSQDDFLSYNRNRILTNLNQKQVSMDLDMCLLHQKQLDVVCIQDATRICANCAIFGQHKGHSFKTVQEIQRQAKKSYKYISAIIQNKKNAEKRIGNEQTQKQIWGLFNRRKDRMRKQVTEGYKKIYQLLKQNQKQNITKLDEAISLAEKRIKSLLKIDEKIVKVYSKWESISLMQSKVLLGQNVQEKLTLLFGPQKMVQNTLKMGSNILEDIKKQQQLFSNRMDDILQKVIVRIIPDAVNQISKYITVDHSFQPQYIVKLPSRRNVVTQPSEQLLLDDSDCPTARRNIQSKQRYSQDEFTSPIKKGLNFCKSTDAIGFSTAIGHKKAASNCKSPIYKKRLHQSTLISPRASLTNNLRESNISTTTKRKTKVKVPEQFSKMLHLVMKDETEVVDFTNAQLGDACISQICEMLGSKVKIVKLIRNKLSDDCLRNVIPYLKNVSVLNLAQNQLTEECLDIIIRSKQELKQLKSIVLSQNKIFQRKNREKVEKIKQLGIMVTM